MRLNYFCKAGPGRKKSTSPFSISIGKLTQIIGLPLLAALILWNGLLPSTCYPAPANQAIERINKGEFYYSGGKRIPLVRHKNIFAVKFKEKETVSGRVTPSPNSVLKRHKGLRLSRKSESFERHKIHLLESSDAGNDEEYDGIIRELRNDPDVEYVQPAFVTGADEPLVMSDCFIAKFTGSLSKEEIDKINAKNAVKIVKSIEVDSNVYVLRVTGLKNRTTLEVANNYYQMDAIEWSHPDWIRRMELRHIPNDPFFPNQWHLNNTGAIGTTDADIGAPEAWDLTKGDAEIIIAIIDDGIDTSHEDFAEKVVFGRDVVNDNDDPNPQSGDNHGTAVAGLAVANQDNGIGVSGVAPNCKLMPIRLLARGMTVSDEAEAFLFAAQNGADIISNSWGPIDGIGAVAPLPDATRAAIDYAADKGRDGKGCIIFFAAGNGDESVDNDGYASYEKVIAVGASTYQDKRAYYSDYGASLDIMAPSSGGSSGITTTDRMGSKGYDSGNYLSSFGGTSAATPIAAGVAALMLSVNGTLSRSNVQEILQYTADKINPVDANYDASGFSEKYGYGRINAYKAVLEAIDPNFPPIISIQSPTEDITIHAGEAAIFAGDIIDNEGDIVSYHWDFAGGAPYAYVEDPGLTTFNTPGTFHVTFTVTDSRGKKSTDSVKILVIRPEEYMVSYRVDSTDTPTSIPNNQPIGISSNVLADIGNHVVKVNVSANITHTWIGNLIVSLESPEGTKIRLHDRSGGPLHNIITTYDTLAEPEESLDAFIGENPQGVWTLHVSDNAALDTGTLNGWQLEIVTIDDGGLEKPDLVVKKMKVKRRRVNKRIRVKTIIKNLGSVESSPFEVTFLLSNDKKLDTNDINLRTIEFGGLQSYKNLRKKVRLEIPPSVSSGKYYLIVKVDPTNVVRELKERNNIRVLQRAIRIR
ncbi:MAG: S8 family serine peptidase [Candidatus Brocadiales bacterium]